MNSKEQNLVELEPSLEQKETMLIQRPTTEVLPLGL